MQVNLNGLPEDVVIKVINDFVEERQAPDRPVKNYEDWLYSSFGKTFAELFPMQYTRKYHTTTAANMSTDWQPSDLSSEPGGSPSRGALEIRHQMCTTSRTSVIQKPVASSPI